MKDTIVDTLGKRDYRSRGTKSWDTPLETSPHYTYHKFDKPQTIFCSEPDNLTDDGFGNASIPGCHYDYSDQIRKWDSKKAEEAVKVANDSGATPRTANWYQAYLSHFYGTPVELKHIIAGVHMSNGDPYYVFGTKQN